MIYDSMVALAIYVFISGYASYKYGGSDKPFLKNAPVDFMNCFKENRLVVYVVVMVILALLLMYMNYLLIFLIESLNVNN